VTDASAPTPAQPATGTTPPIILVDRRMFWLIVFLAGTSLFANAQFNDYVQKNFIRKEPVITYNLEPGATTELDLTVVTGDAKRLMCGADKELEGTHCAMYSDKRRFWPRPEGAPMDDNYKDIIQPYRTLAHNQLVLVSGLWAQPEVAMRVHQESPDALPVKRQARFTALCKVKMLGKLDEVQVRWEPGQQWYTEKNAPVGRVESCKIAK
jgi:hypothetical protein